MLCGHTHRFSWNPQEETLINCPILVEGPNDRIDVKVTKDYIIATIINKNGKILGSYELK